MSAYPQCEKLAAVCDERNAIVEFLEWMANEHGARLCNTPGPLDHWHPVFRNAQDLAHEFFCIDERALEAERRAILAAARKVSP